MLAVITTCAKRLKVLSLTMASLAASDWDYPVIVTSDVEASLQEGDTPDQRSNRNFKKAIERAIYVDCPWFLLLEDDSEINRHIKHNLNRWAPLQSGKLSMGGLSTNGGNRVSFGEGLHYYTPDSSRVYGLQGAILTKAFACYALDHWDDVRANVDIKLSRLAGSNKCGRYYKYWPSLVRHRHEVNSVCNHGVIKTEGFDLNHKA